MAGQARDRWRARPRRGVHRACSRCRPRGTAAASRSRWVLHPAFVCSPPSWPTSLYAGCLQQLGQFLARIKQARLDGVLRNTDDFGHLFHRLLVVVDEIDDLPMIWRKRGQALAQRVTRILLLHHHFRVVGRILDRVRTLVVQSNVLAAPERRKSLKPRNRQEPGGNGGSAFELASLPPHIEKNLADEVFRNLFIPYEPKPETEHPDMVPSVKHLHGEAVALGDPSDQNFV